jgi:ligand-binding sensor domain-containing protein
MQRAFRRYRPVPLLLLFSALIASPVLRAQDETYISYNEKYGLNRNYINSMVRDSSGYFWLGTEKGTIRFDGANFTELSPSSGNQFLSSVLRVKTAGHHLLIIYEDGRLQRLNLVDFKLEDLPNRSARDMVQLDDQHQFVLQQDGWLVGYENGKEKQRRRMSKDITAAQSQLYLWQGRLFVVIPDVGAYWLSPQDLHTMGTPQIDLSTVRLYFSEFGEDMYVFAAG